MSNDVKYLKHIYIITPALHTHTAGIFKYSGVVTLLAPVFEICLLVQTNRRTRIFNAFIRILALYLRIIFLLYNMDQVNAFYRRRWSCSSGIYTYRRH